jgi:hypothetical protein
MLHSTDMMSMLWPKMIPERAYRVVDMLNRPFLWQIPVHVRIYSVRRLYFFQSLRGAYGGLKCLPKSGQSPCWVSLNRAGTVRGGRGKDWQTWQQSSGGCIGNDSIRRRYRKLVLA